jgi:hypothetical protein
MLSLTDQHESGLAQSHESSPLSIDDQFLSKPIHLSHSGLDHRLPHELLAGLFLIGLDSRDASDMDWHDHSRRSMNKYLHRLTAACTFWRFVAVPTSILWAKICCVVSIPTNVDGLSGYLESRLERSINVLLDLWLESSHYPDYLAMCRVVKIIYPHLHRCRAITLVFQNEDEEA